MAEDNILIDIEQATEALMELNRAIETFEPYTDGFLKNSYDKLEGFNSDFIESYKRLFKILRSDSGKKLIKNLKGYHEGMTEVVKGFKELDEEMASKLEEQS